MKKTFLKRLSASFLMLSIILTASGCKGEKNIMKIDFKPSASDFDSALFTNPDRGFRLESYTNLSFVDPSVNIGNIKQWNAKFEAAANKVQSGIWAKPKLDQVYCYLTEYRETEILPEVVFKNLREIFKALKQEEMKGVIRFAYQGSMTAKEEQASDEIMLSHMKQLKPVLEEYKELIHTIEIGFLGSWGEWHSFPGFTWEERLLKNDIHDGEKIIKGVLDMAPEGIYVQARYPGVKNLIDKDDPDYARIGYNNDAFFGYRNEGSAWPYDEMNNAASRQAAEESLYVPMGGEFFWGKEWQYKNVTAAEAIKLFAFFHQNTFSVFHNSFECTPEVAGEGEGAMWFASDREGDMTKWIKTPITKNEINAYGAYVSDAWFEDKNGNAAQRNAFEYVRDHLGYRIEAKNLTVTGDIKAGKKIDLSMELVNYGFSAAFNMEGEFVVLDGNYEIVARASAGDPEGWNNIGELATHKADALIELPKEGGEYKIAYYLHNSAGEGAYFANSFDRIKGFNILYSLTV